MQQHYNLFTSFSSFFYIRLNFIFLYAWNNYKLSFITFNMMISRCLPLVDIAATCCAVLGVEDSYLCICSSINNMLSLQGKQGPVLVCVCVCNDAYKHTALHRSNNAGNTCWYAICCQQHMAALAQPIVCRRLSVCFVSCLLCFCLHLLFI